LNRSKQTDRFSKELQNLQIKERLQKLSEILFSPQ